MPKYYRFRATTPSRKPKRIKEKDKEQARPKVENESTWLDLTLACSPAPSWYLRRISWRETPPLMGLHRQLAAGFRASMQFSSRSIFVLKLPSNYYT